MKIAVVLLAVSIGMGCTGCAKKAATAPVPGSINSLDAYAFRSVADAQAAIHSVKTWEQCSAHSFPASVDIDGTAEPCDSKAGAFPEQHKSYLNTAINAYNVASGAAKAYHDGGGQNAAALTQDLAQLGNDIATLLTKTGGH